MLTTSTQSVSTISCRTLCPHESVPLDRKFDPFCSCRGCALHVAPPELLAVWANTLLLLLLLLLFFSSLRWRCVRTTDCFTSRHGCLFSCLSLLPAHLSICRSVLSGCLCACMSVKVFSRRNRKRERERRRRKQRAVGGFSSLRTVQPKRALIALWSISQIFSLLSLLSLLSAARAKGWPSLVVRGLEIACDTGCDIFG